MNKKTLAVLGIFLSLVCITPRAEADTLRMGILPVIDTLPLLVAQEKGLFEKHGVDVELITFNSALERDAALSSSRIDGYFADLVITLLLNRGGSDLRIITESYHTTDKRMFGLLASKKSGITDKSQIAKIPVAISSGSVIEFFLDQILLSEGISPSGVRKMEVKAIPVRFQMLMTGSLDLALLPEPLASKAIAEGANIIADDTSLDTTATILAVRQKYIAKNKGVMENFLAAYAQSVEMINNDPDSFMDVIVNKTRFPVSLKGSYHLPVFPSPALPREDDIMTVQNWLIDKSLMKTPLDYDSIVWRPEQKK